MVLALEYLHSQMRVCHRDLKPANIMVTDKNYIKIIDFGDCKAVIDENDSILTESSEDPMEMLNLAKRKRRSFVGTPLYVPPEMLENSSSGFFTDLWAIGCIIYEMAVGISPFHAKTSS